MQLRSFRISVMLQGVPEIVGPSKRQADACCRASIQWHVRSLHTSFGPACGQKLLKCFHRDIGGLGRRRM